MQLQMVISDFKGEGTGTEHVAIATLECVPSDRFHRAQHSCQRISGMTYFSGHLQFNLLCF